MKKFMPYRDFLIFIFCLTGTASVFADTLILKDGSRIEGTVVDRKDNKISVQTRYGLLQFDKDFVEQEIPTASSTPAVTYSPSANASGTPTMLYHGFRFSFDVYGKGNAYDTIKNTFESNVRALGATFGHAEGQFDINSTGVGLTAGYVFTAKTEGSLEHGPQIQLLDAPDAKLKLRVTDASQTTLYANESDVIHTGMWRLTWQFGVPVKLSETICFIPRFDVGALFGKIYFDNDSTSETWNGMTFSLAPSLLIGKPRNERGAHFELGASYTYIPPKDASDNFDKFEWTAIGMHAGALWMF